jgi:hypothetical protein
MPDPYAAAMVCGAFLFLVYAVLHVAGPTLHQPEFYSRPFYYGIGFAAFLGALGAWVVWLGPDTVLRLGTVAICVLIISGEGALGMLTMYLWDNMRERREAAVLDQADPHPPGPPHADA